MRQTLIALSAIAALSGCGTPVQPTVVNTLPASLTVNCDYPPPPDVATYKAAPWIDKEKLWKQTYDSGLVSNADCNARLKQVRQLNKGQ